ncbi:GNAT family N-acetyltransferase [Streptomonospora sediminis]
MVGPNGCTPEEAGHIRELVDGAGERSVTVEDHSAELEFPGQAGLSMRTIPVMVRLPGPPAGDGPDRSGAVHVRELATAGELGAAERMIVEDFPVRAFQPHVPHRMLPAELQADPSITFLGAWRAHGGEASGAGAAGTCLVLNEAGAAGIYWLVTAGGHRSGGVGRALMTAALRLLPDLPAVLCATPAGAPLYRSLGFEHIADSHWWSR